MNKMLETVIIAFISYFIAWFVQQYISTVYAMCAVSIEIFIYIFFYKCQNTSIIFCISWPVFLLLMFLYNLYFGIISNKKNQEYSSFEILAVSLCPLIITVLTIGIIAIHFYHAKRTFNDIKKVFSSMMLMLFNAFK